MALAQVQRPQFVVEFNDLFLQLWPYRSNFIQAPFPELGEKARWRTVSYHPLSDRLMVQGGALFGVRFGRETSYLMLDVDTDSPYHPNHDGFALGQIRAALEMVGLHSCITLTSSASGGLHLYFPFQKPMKSYKLAEAATALLHSKGFKISSGQLELFPNTKNYKVSGSPSLFNAHRLPLQEPASHLLNDDLEPIFSSREVFLSLWKQCAAHNDITAKKISRILKTKKRKSRFISVSANEFLEDLNADINPGWSSKHQSNFIFGRIVMREFIFHHVTAGGVPLTGHDLIQECISIAKSLPGFKTFCRHQHELAKRITDWVRSIENSHYFPYGKKSGKYKAVKPTSDNESAESKETWNQQQVRIAQAKIVEAVARLQGADQWPTGATARFKRLKQENCGSSTLYKHLHLWHPNHQHQEEGESRPEQGEKNESKGDKSLQCDVPARLEEANWHNHTSLLQANGRNNTSAEDFRDLAGGSATEGGRNSLVTGAGELGQPLDVEALRQAQALVRRQQLAQQVARFLFTDDPILVDEAVQTLLYQPALLMEPQVAEAIEHAAIADPVSLHLALLQCFVRARWTVGQIMTDLQSRFQLQALAALSRTQLLAWFQALSLG